MTAYTRRLRRARAFAKPKKPVAKGSVAKKPVAKKPVTRKPVTKKPVTKKPVAKKPVTKKPVAKKPVAKKPVAKKPVARKPVARKPVTKKPVAKKPVTKKPVAKKPVAIAKKPVAKKPVAKKPVAKKPVAKKPVAKKPVAKKPVAKKPVAKKPPAKKPPAKRPLTPEEQLAEREKLLPEIKESFWDILEKARRRKELPRPPRNRTLWNREHEGIERTFPIRMPLNERSLEQILFATREGAREVRQEGSLWRGPWMLWMAVYTISYGGELRSAYGMITMKGDNPLHQNFVVQAVLTTGIQLSSGDMLDECRGLLENTLDDQGIVAYVHHVTITNYRKKARGEG